MVCGSSPIDHKKAADFHRRTGLHLLVRRARAGITLIQPFGTENIADRTHPDGSKSILIQIIHDGMGDADTALQHTLLRKYLLLLQENHTLPGAICFYTSGVKMVVEGSPILDVLQSLETQGVHLIVCARTVEDVTRIKDRIDVLRPRRLACGFGGIRHCF